MKFINAILITCFLVVNCAFVYSEESSDTLWNSYSQSQILEKEQLNSLGNALQPWQIKQMTWPNAEEISASSVDVDNNLKLSCKKWLEKFISKNYLPNELENNLIPMKNWGLISKVSEQKRLCDVFITRYSKNNYTVHIQESPYNIVVSVADERITKDPNADHKKLVIDIANMLLNENLKPDPNSENLHIYEMFYYGYKITRLTWFIDSVIVKDRDGNKCKDLTKASKVGTSNVKAETNGRFVRFEFIKETGSKAAYCDPYEERFSPAPVEPEEKPKKPRFVPPAPGPGGFGPIPENYDPNSAPPPKKNP